MRHLYSNEDKGVQYDPRSHKLNEMFERLKKSFNMENEILDEIVEKIDVLNLRKIKNMAKGKEHFERLKQWRELQNKRDQELELLEHLKELHGD